MKRGGRCSPRSPAAVDAGDGVLVKTMGDGCLASFGSAADAITAAVAVQQAAARLRVRKVPGLGLRVGMAVGDVTEEDDDVFGPAVVTGEPAVQRRGRASGPGHRPGAHARRRPRRPSLRGDRRTRPEGHRRPGGRVQRSGRAARRRPSLPAALAATPAEQVVGREEELDMLNMAFKAASGASDVPCSSPGSRGWARPAWWQRWPAGPTTRARWCCSVAAGKTSRWRTSPSPRPCGRGVTGSGPRGGGGPCGGARWRDPAPRPGHRRRRSPFGPSPRSSRPGSSTR